MVNAVSVLMSNTQYFNKERNLEGEQHTVATDSSDFKKN